ncbi:MAG: hypothetical protein AAGB48_07530 [Planctomycetota bacterium]
MFKPLRHPTAFLALTLCLFGWLSAWSFAPTGRPLFPVSSDDTSHDNRRPLFWLASRMPGPGLMERLTLPSRDDFGPRRFSAVLKMNAGTTAIWIENTTEGRKLGEDVIAGAWVTNRSRTESIGLLATVVYRYHSEIAVRPLPIDNLPLLDGAEATRAALDAEMVSPQFTRSTFNWFAAMHDLLFTVAAGLWLYAGIGCVANLVRSRNKAGQS